MIAAGWLRDSSSTLIARIGQRFRSCRLLLVSTKTTLLAVGLEALVEAGNAWARDMYTPTDMGYVVTGDAANDLPVESRFRVSGVEPDKLFAFWSAYDGVQCIIVRASVITALPERTRRAILDWQRGGGELVVIVDDASNAWRRWLPEGQAGDLVTLDETKTVPASIAFDGFVSHTKEVSAQDASLADPVEMLPARVLSLTPQGQSHAWTILFRGDYGDGAGLIARGPAGLGFVTIVGFDPARVAALQSKKTRSLAWGFVLNEIITQIADPVEDHQMRYYASGSGATANEANALNSAMDATLRTTGMSSSVLYLIIVVLVGFVIAVGPIDALVLRRFRLRHWSWLTALIWIVLASLLAVQVPNLTLGGATHFGRFAVTDAVLDDEANPVTSWTTGVNTIYAGSAAKIQTIDNRSGSWWRGISPISVWQFGGNRPAGALGTLNLMMRNEVSSTGTRLTSSPAAMPQRGWTARAMLDVAPSVPIVTATLDGSDSGWVLSLQQHSNDVQISGVDVTVGRSTWRKQDIEFERPISLMQSEARPAQRMKDRDFNTRFAGSLDYSSTMQFLPGSANRHKTLLHLADSPHMAMIEVAYSTSVPVFEVSGVDTIEERGIVRLIVPIRQQEPTP